MLWTQPKSRESLSNIEDPQNVCIYVSMMRLVLCMFDVLLGVLLFAIPNMSRRELLFAVPVPPNFRESRAGRHAVAAYRTAIAVVALAGACALAF